MTEPRGQAEEWVYRQQVQAYRRRFLYTMVHDRRDSRAAISLRANVLPVDVPADGGDGLGCPESEKGEGQALHSIAAAAITTDTRTRDGSILGAGV